jgi:hypothetical protein
MTKQASASELERDKTMITTRVFLFAFWLYENDFHATGSFVYRIGQTLENATHRIQDFWP